MTPTPKKFGETWGGAKFKKAWAQICRAIDDRTPIAGPGILPSEQPGQGIILAAQPAAAAGEESEPCPFDIDISSTATGSESPSESEVFINLTPGTINQLLPSNMFVELSTANEGLFYIVLECATNGKQITSAELTVGSTPPPVIGVDEAAVPIELKILIGVIVDGRATKTIGCGSIVATPKEAFRVDRASPVPGLTPYVSWYTWLLTLV